MNKGSIVGNVVRSVGPKSSFEAGIELDTSKLKLAKGPRHDVARYSRLFFADFGEEVARSLFKAKKFELVGELSLADFKRVLKTA